MIPLRYEPYDQLADTPHVVVDGAAQESTRLTLSHWPGSPTPPGVADDLSAQIAFHALDHPDWFDGVDVVSNNHFDQDGLCSVYALVDPQAAVARRAQVIDVARAGDFGTWTDRTSARLAMTVAAYDDPERSPLGAEAFAADYPDQCALLYRTLLPRLTDLLDHPESVEELWADEDAQLQAGLDAIADGTVHIEEIAKLDLAVVTIPAGWADETVHRFTSRRDTPIHPMAVNNATARTRLITVTGDGIRIEQRYETWVIHPSRVLAPRQDLQLLAAELTALETGDARWQADPPRAITPILRLAGGSSGLTIEQVRQTAEHFFATAPSAWDPAAPRPT